VTGNKLSVSAADVDGINEVASITVSATDGTVVDTNSFTITIDNSSLTQLINELQEISSNAIDVVKRNSINSVIIRYTEQAYMLGLISIKEKDAIFFQTDELSNGQELIDASRRLVEQSLAVTSEVTLLNYVATWRISKAMYINDIRASLSQIVTYGDIGLPEILSDDIKSEDMFRIFYGNSAYGQFEMGTFSYSEKYQLLNSLNAFEGGGVCPTNQEI
jgi:hypothetical protein